MSDQELRLHAMQMAIKHAENVEHAFDVDLKHIATEIYEFIKGESK
jgi:hypothetical protein